MTGNALYLLFYSDLGDSLLAQLYPTAKASSKVPGLFRFFGPCIFVSPVPGPIIPKGSWFKGAIAELPSAAAQSARPAAAAAPIRYGMTMVKRTPM